MKEKQKQRTYDTEGCYFAHNTMFQFKTDQMRLFEDRRDRNRSESRPCRAERESVKRGDRKTGKEQEIYPKAGGGHAISDRRMCL